MNQNQLVDLAAALERSLHKDTYDGSWRNSQFMQGLSFLASILRVSGSGEFIAYVPGVCSLISFAGRYYMTDLPHRYTGVTLIHVTDRDELQRLSEHVQRLGLLVPPSLEEWVDNMAA